RTGPRDCPWDMALSAGGARLHGRRPRDGCQARVRRPRRSVPHSYGRTGRRRRGPELVPRYGCRGRDTRDERGGCRDLRRAAAEDRLAPSPDRPDIAPGPSARAVELARERAPRAEEQRLDSAFGQAELLRDLAVREALPLAEEDRPLLVRRQLGERVGETRQLVVRPLRRGREPRHPVRVLHELPLVAAPGRALPLAADVLGDLEQPGRLRPRHDALAQPAEGVHERVLDGVLRLLAARQPAEAVAEDPPRVR